ncbi:hypothetical protein [Sulfuricurvum sp.]|uniref:hypothetical protein n=1 Tax=Sulfuricurvum sp. TaxID=2025608 RepID=UPI002621E8A8|nr:hypothetical protein [Sulfuricurvum sp.]MDD2781028.1 hypothetical protein [Sulfuricurvum sp.]
MNKEAFEIAQAVLLSLGGGSVIVFALSNFLGKVWADRILRNQKIEHDRELSEFKSHLESMAQKNSFNYQQKLELYKVITIPLVEISVLIKNGLSTEHIKEFDRQRLHLIAQLALFAPQNVFDAFNEMIDYIYDSLENDDYSFSIFRVKALNFLSEIRKDIGIYNDSLSYKGHR